MLVAMHSSFQVPYVNGMKLHGSPGNTYKDVFGVIANVYRGDKIGVNAPGVDLAGNGSESLGELGVDQNICLLPRGDHIVFLDPKGPREIPDP